MSEPSQDYQRLQKALAARIRERRIRKAWSQKMLAQLSGISERHIAQLERGELDVRLSALLALAGTFDVTMSDFFRGMG